MSTSCCTDNVTLNDSNQTPNPSSNNLSSSQLTKVNLDEIKVIRINCCSLRSLSRRARLCGLIHEHKPDIIVGCKSHLDDSYTSSETFPVGYNVYKKDRAVGGGVYS